MKNSFPITAKKFQQYILNWFAQHGRKNLPWQIDKSPYRVWVSEIMLQQTQVSTVIPYYQRFMQNFPTLSSLAEASEEEVLHLWTGLGYYTRARNLYRTAKMINQRGEFPHEIVELQSLPGIGRSTAGAILSIAFGKGTPILDGNVKRVLSRLTTPAIKDEKKFIEYLWKIAEYYTPKENVSNYTQAMMDLGATICVRSNPRCNLCPLQKICLAKQNNLIAEFPLKKIRPQIPIKKSTLIIFKKNHFIFLMKRPAKGVWAKLWGLPELNDTHQLLKLTIYCQKTWIYQPRAIKKLKPFRHTFSHFHLDILPVIISLKENENFLPEDSKHIWYNLLQPPKIGLPMPIKKLLASMEKINELNSAKRK